MLTPLPQAFFLRRRPGASARKTYDPRWLLGQTLREIRAAPTSATTRPAARVEIPGLRRTLAKLRLLHRSTARASPSAATLVAIPEQYQQADGSVRPEALRLYLRGLDRITKRADPPLRRPRGFCVPCGRSWDMRPATPMRALRLLALCLLALPAACATTGAAARSGAPPTLSPSGVTRAPLALRLDPFGVVARGAGGASARSSGRPGTSRQATLAEAAPPRGHRVQAGATQRRSRRNSARGCAATARTQAPYARFMIARCHVEQMPEDWFLTPPQWGRTAAHDLEHGPRPLPSATTATRPTRRPAIPPARARTLVRHGIYVANFYGSRDRHAAAAASRLRRRPHHYRGSTLEPLALLRLGRDVLQLGQLPGIRGAPAAPRALPQRRRAGRRGPTSRASVRRPPLAVQLDEAPPTEETGATET